MSVNFSYLVPFNNLWLTDFHPSDSTMIRDIVGPAPNETNQLGDWEL